ncbi:MAG: NAD(P)/FAD-dependent oxidoreductase, partial [Candidatus Aenigmarchaeota archaeon]|nr:NAD(P)/FAD-dependent oxidoreductase [Candidatus Aenigmarchaeota archaeon]
IQSITNSIIASMPETTVIKTGQDVKKIKKDGKLFTITTDDDVYDSEIVVFAAELRCLENILENPLPKKYIEKIATLKKSSRAMTLWLGLKRKRPEFDYLGSEVWFDEETPYWAMPTSNYDKNLAPEGMQLVGFGSRILAGESPAKHKEKLLRTIKKVAWRIEKDIVMEHVQVTYPDKASITVGAKFPGPKTPIDGLYAVGTDVDPRSMGITRAAYSVVEMLKEMNEDKLI